MQHHDSIDGQRRRDILPDTALVIVTAARDWWLV